MVKKAQPTNAFANLKYSDVERHVKKTAKPKDKIDKTVLQNSTNLVTDALHSFEYDGFH